jgi:hypothetical protein
MTKANLISVVSLSLGYLQIGGMTDHDMAMFSLRLIGNN